MRPVCHLYLHVAALRLETSVISWSPSGSSAVSPAIAPLTSNYDLNCDVADGPDKTARAVGVLALLPWPLLLLLLLLVGPLRQR